jgi:uncharacterized damage-inducible protein DinB
MPITQRPVAGEYAPYFDRYMPLVPEGDLIEALARSNEETRALLGSIDEAAAARPYAPGKWSIKQIVQHLIDCERVFCYRALSFARGEKAELPGFDHEGFAVESRADARPLGELAAEYAAVRAASIALMAGLPKETLARSGVANKNKLTPLALGCLMVGHERHHMNVIREKYLAGAGV